MVPDGVVVDDRIVLNLTYSDDADCARPRDTMEPLTIGGQAGRLRGLCGVEDPPNPEIEATVVVGDHVYLFTLFDYREGGDIASEEQARASFDASTATITLDPGTAAGSPHPSSS